MLVVPGLWRPQLLQTPRDWLPNCCKVPVRHAFSAHYLGSSPSSFKVITCLGLEEQIYDAALPFI
jgi:hypothetical protein